MVWIAIVLGVFLFYKFVERPHKVIFFKIAGASVALGCIIIGGILLYEKVKPQEKVRSDITVEYSYHSSKLNKEVKRKIAEQMFSSLTQESYRLSGLSRQQLLVAKQVYFGFYIDGLNALEPILQTDPNEFNFLVDSWSDDPEKSKPARVRYDELHRARLNRYIGDLISERNVIKTDNERRYFGFVLAAKINSIDDKLKNEFEKHLTKDELQVLHSTQEDVANQAEAIMQEFNKLKPDSEIGFKVCNNEDKPLNSYSFYVSGFDKGRSTANNLEFSGYGDDTRFEGDIIIPPKSCSSMTWNGKYRMFNRYEIKLVNGTWAAN